MKNMKKVLSLIAACSIIATFSAITPVYADNEITITPVVEVKIGSASYTAYTDQELSAGDKVRVKYEYAGPATNEIWSEAWYDEDNDIDYPAELKGGTSIVQSGFYVDYLDADYFTAGNPTFYVASQAAQWLGEPMASGKTEDGLGFSYSTMAAYVNKGIYKSAGRIAQIIYTLSKDLDKDVVIGPADFNYKFTLATAGVDGVETGNVIYETKTNGVKFNTVTLKGTSGEEEPTLETVPATEFTYDENAQLKGEEFVKDDSEDVDVYVAEYTFKSGQTKFFWSATIDSKTKKTADKAIPNVDGQAKLGIIIPASVGATAVALNVQ